MSDQGLDDRDTNEVDLAIHGREGTEGEHGIARILVALDPSEHSRAALEAGARMALRLDAELIGLFIEDVNVRRLAELPFAQEVGLFTGGCRRVETHELSRQLRVQAGSVRRRFRTVTQRVETRCTFRQVRGRVAPEVLRAATEADVVILGKGAWSPFETERLTPAVREVLSQAPASTLVLRAGTGVEPPMRAVYDGTSQGDRALSIAARLAEDGHLMVFILADDPDKASRLQQAAVEHLKERELELTFQTLTESSVSRLAHLVAVEALGTLVMPADDESMEDEAVLDFLDETGAPVLLVR